jgi:hypothetical protein
MMFLILRYFRLCGSGVFQWWRLKNWKGGHTDRATISLANFFPFK